MVSKTMSGWRVYRMCLAWAFEFFMVFFSLVMVELIFTTGWSRGLGIVGLPKVYEKDNENVIKEILV